MDFSTFFDYNAANADAVSTSEGTEVFLANLPEEEWTRLLSVAQRRTFNEGELLIKEGEISRAFYIVSSGRLEVFMKGPKGKERHVHDVEPLSIFGEQAFFDGLPRSASVRAQTDGELFSITAEGFEVLAIRHPDLTRVVL